MIVDDTGKQALISVVRSLLVAGGSMLTMKGLVTEVMWNTVVGAITTILPILWGVWDKYRAEAATKAREAVALNAGIAAANSGFVPPPAPPPTAEIIKAFAPKDAPPAPAVRPAPQSKLPPGAAKP